ncbi:hypothetical protein [Streptococcus ovis]|uniref:hypothetical protein n=1 Tax=Streptococcus ovis TaxID=82806 RepID=UPI0003A3D215|nr:hypothetical protein [Streptococcus ovis]
MKNYLKSFGLKRKKIETEAGFSHREDDKLYFSNWLEDPDYREIITVVDFETGRVIEEMDGYLREVPNGEVWRLE